MIDHGSPGSVQVFLTDDCLPYSPSAAPGLKSSDPEVLRAYYQRLFPFRYLFQWLNHSPAPTNDFAHREFAFTLQNDAYLRYQSFPSADLYVNIRMEHTILSTADICFSFLVKIQPPKTMHPNDTLSFRDWPCVLYKSARTQDPPPPCRRLPAHRQGTCL